MILREHIPLHDLLILALNLSIKTLNEFVLFSIFHLVLFDCLLMLADLLLSILEVLGQVIDLMLELLILLDLLLVLICLVKQVCALLFELLEILFELFIFSPVTLQGSNGFVLLYFVLFESFYRCPLCDNRLHQFLNIRLIGSVSQLCLFLAEKVFDLLAEQILLRCLC